MDWFLYDRDQRHERAKYNSAHCIKYPRIGDCIKPLYSHIRTEHSNIPALARIFHSSRSIFMCPKSTMKTAEQYVKSVQS